MKIIRNGAILNVSDIEELDISHAAALQAAVSDALPATVAHIRVDLSQTTFVDCSGVGALIALRNCLRQRNGQSTMRVLNPPRAVQRILELTGIDIPAEHLSASCSEALERVPAQN